MILNTDVQLNNAIVPPADLLEAHRAKVVAAIEADLNEMPDDQLSREAEQVMQQETGVCPSCHDLLFQQGGVVVCYHCFIIRPVHMAQTDEVRVA